MEGVYRGNERREEVRSRQNKLIENEALAEVQLAAFPWESLSLPPPVPRERTGGHAFSETETWFLGREFEREAWSVETPVKTT